MIYIYDLGGQYCHMLKRRLRDGAIEAEIVDPHTRARDILDPQGIILSGGPQSVYADQSPKVDPAILMLNVPILGICYGHQLLASMLGGMVERGTPEFGETIAVYLERSDIFAGHPAASTVWMSHTDAVVSLPSMCEVLAHTRECAIAAFADRKRRFFGVQYHPEVSHTEHGDLVLANFLHLCGVEPADLTDSTVHILQNIRAQVGRRKVFFFVSGGVDSTVAFTLCAKALDLEQLLAVYVDTGLMRLHETDELVAMFDELGFGDRLVVCHEAERFLGALDGVCDPEEKRRIIGRAFVEVQHEVMQSEHLDDGWLLGQGTIYPDVIESGKSGSAKIKTHHNQCAEIKELLDAGLVVEPLRELYKDQVRVIGRSLGIAAHFLDRWPFPGPGLAIRCLCAVEATHLFTPISHARYEVCRLPLRSVGVQGDDRTYRSTLAVRGPLDHDGLVSLAQTFHQDRIIAYLGGSAGALDQGKIRPATITSKRIAMLQQADYIVRQYMDSSGLANDVWQFPVVLLPLSYAGGETIVLRPVNSTDGMTANFASLPEHDLRTMTDRILKVTGIDAVFLDASHKPPATIEWE